MVSNGRVGITLRLIGLCCAVLALSACEPSMDEVVAEHRAPVQAVFDRIKALDATVRNTPPVSEDRIDLGSDKVVLEGENQNALLIQADDLNMPEFASSDDIGATYASTIETCGEALDGRFQGISLGAQSFLEECARAEYLFVMRTHATEGAQTVDRETFQPGSYEGDVLLFRLADGALLGGFRVSATNNDTVTTREDVSDADERLESDLSSNVFVAIGDGVRKHVPGSLPAP